MRRVTGFGLLVVVALLLAACGGDSTDDEATATSEPTQAATEAVAEPTTPAATIPDATAATIASPVASTPADSTPAAGTPVVPIDASPIAATPMASPVASPVAGTGSAALAGEANAGTQLLSGTVLLPGTPNDRFVISGDGCIGLDTYAGLQAGQQVIVRDESGTVIGTANLAATSSQVVCSWTFEVEVPVSGYYVVSIPMRAEQAFAAADVEATGGQVEVTLP